MGSRGSGVLGYNVQSAVESKHHLIIAHRVSNVGSDRSQPSSLAKQAKAILDVEQLDVVADRGYYNGDEIRRYWTSACTSCAIKAQCTDGGYRRVSRWVHADVLERAQARLDRQPDLMQTRRSTVEHPFATINAWRGSTHFLTRTIPR